MKEIDHRAGAPLIVLITTKNSLVDQLQRLLVARGVNTKEVQNEEKYGCDGARGLVDGYLAWSSPL
jgi:hypothetical protein